MPEIKAVIVTLTEEQKVKYEPEESLKIRAGDSVVWAFCGAGDGFRPAILFDGAATGPFAEVTTHGNVVIGRNAGAFTKQIYHFGRAGAHGPLPYAEGFSKGGLDPEPEVRGP